MLAFMIQWGGERYHPGPINLLQPLLVLAVGVAAGVLILAVLEQLVPRGQRRLRSWRARRRRRQAALHSEVRARAVMSELCPHGWRAEITLFEHPVAEETALEAMFAPDPAARVRLEWTELRDQSGAPAVMRELWARSVGEALERMVADRRTDEALEQIEQGAVAEGALWPDRE